MGAGCMKQTVVEPATEHKDNAGFEQVSICSNDSGERSPDAVSNEIQITKKIIAAQRDHEDEDGDVVKPTKTHNLMVPRKSDAGLSEIVENLFMQHVEQVQCKNASPDTGNEVPIQIEQLQIKRRMKKQRESSAAQIINTDAAQRKTAQREQEANCPAAEWYPLISENDDEKATHISIRESDMVQSLAGEKSRDEKHGNSTVMTGSASVEPDRFYLRVLIAGKDVDFLTNEVHDIAVSLMHALRMRQFYSRLARQHFSIAAAKALSVGLKKDYKPPNYQETFDVKADAGKPLPPDQNQFEVRMERGVIGVIDSSNNNCEHPLPTLNRERFITNRNILYALVTDGPLKSFCYRRLCYLKNKFDMHILLNEHAELEVLKNPKRNCRRDFYNVRKVDTHIHAAACMSQKHLLGFMRNKMEEEPERIVLIKKGKPMSLQDVFTSLHLDFRFLNVESLDVHAGRQTFHRFDRFNHLYSPMGASELREIFLKTNNHIGGEYFAQIINQIETKLGEQKYHLLELRLSIYGKSADEWHNLASWFKTHRLASFHIRWLIQVPRLYDIYAQKSAISSFQEMLTNIFKPIFEATLRPNKYEDLSIFLRYVFGFDSVDDESKPETGFMKKTSPTPDEWQRPSNPSYTYYIYYMYVNIMRLNHLRHSRGMNTFTLRPHCGEAGHHDHVISAFLLADNINHGLVLKTVPVIQYLYYLAQMGVCMSPLSNNHLFLEYQKSPFPEYFAKGLNVCLSTDDPLQFHYTMEPLTEEYAVAAQVWKLSVCDMCELAANSVRISGFSHAAKKRWLGDNYRNEDASGNDISKTNVPNIRISFRNETLHDELRFLTDTLLSRKNDRDDESHLTVKLGESKLGTPASEID